MDNIMMKIPLDQLKDRVCKCGGFIFVTALALKEVPTVYSPSGKPETAMQQVGFMCINCGEVLTVAPEEPKEDKSLLGESKSKKVNSESKIVIAKN